ncbi:pantoate--beta-alanine ligase [Mucilaginibacter roseus]|uniref:Pantothenate synthetase n=1 Tax=Mucilaginibacter roseus TaxID=1528868 RepID=A0ABS8U6C9_9SPHI|nr:pantoate--beta-alanine ligase [Mucilaginibacter roseus]MCD8741404.1 pantoate--beta-alanine ligase [Mucilaginibacter roseus]
MKNFTTKQRLNQHLLDARASGATIGFVPTMGALHQGHLSLIARARQDCDIVVCSIFVNPTQFNDPKDLEKYPRPIEADIVKLEQAGCDVLFNPDVTEMYAGNEQWHLDIGELEHLLEGQSRPGHYQGVTQVVYKLFSIVEPDSAYFGQKDFQQVLVINRMVDLMKMPVKIVMCPIEREGNGLAMSSRNVHLSATDREHALVLSQALKQVKDNFNREDIATLKQQAENSINNEPDVQLDYLEIADAKTLHPANQNTANVVALVAARVGTTRLIDNMIIR